VGELLPLGVAMVTIPGVGPLLGLYSGLCETHTSPSLILAVALLDYTLYLWHILTHRLPFLWRFHKAHHVDLDMDASTALRFHFGELALATVWRAGQVVLIGVSARALSLWQTFTLVEILFHHSDIELPAEVERWLSRVIVTPRLHGIHHSAREGETNSNWSSGLTVWDWLHGTLRTTVPQDSIIIGVAGLREQQSQELPRLLSLPFRGAVDVVSTPASRVREPVGQLEN